MENYVVLNAKQVADRLSLSTSTLAKMRLYGNGPTYSKLGRRVVYDPQDVMNWIEQNRCQSTSEYSTDKTHIQR